VRLGNIDEEVLSSALCLTLARGLVKIPPQAQFLRQLIALGEPLAWL